MRLVPTEFREESAVTIPKAGLPPLHQGERDRLTRCSGGIEVQHIINPERGFEDFPSYQSESIANDIKVYWSHTVFSFLSHCYRAPPPLAI